jgi:regulation of enolase protein 1 (concanavalin A-like superfamily)
VEPLTIISDDFNHNNLKTALWAIINPLSDAIVKLEGAGFGDAKLLLTVPAGLSHDPWNENEAARLMQAAADTDFEIEVKFDSLVQQRYQDQGIIVEQSANNWLRFDVFSDGSQTYIFAASVANGTPSVKIYKAIAAAAPIYLNVERTGNTWSLSYSYDGLAWTVAGSFTHALAVTAVGPYAGNYDEGTNAPAHTAVIDYLIRR